MPDTATLDPTAMADALSRLAETANHGCGLVYELFARRFSSAVDSYVAGRPAAEQAAILALAVEYGYCSPEEIAAADRHDAEAGICRHGLDAMTCPCGCFEGDDGDDYEPFERDDSADQEGFAWDADDESPPQPSDPIGAAHTDSLGGAGDGRDDTPREDETPTPALAMPESAPFVPERTLHAVLDGASVDQALRQEAGLRGTTFVLGVMCLSLSILSGFAYTVATGTSGIGFPLVGAVLFFFLGVGPRLFHSARALTAEQIAARRAAVIAAADALAERVRQD